MARKPNMYSAYVFRGEKDPEIDRIRGLSEAHYGGKLTGSHITKMHKGGGPSASCMRNWFFGDTKRPQNATLEAAGRAMGFERVWRPMRKRGSGT